MPRKVPRVRWDDPLRALDALAAVWSSTGLPLVSAGAARSVVLPYRTLFTTLQQLLVGREITVRVGNHNVVLTVTEFDSPLEPQALAVGQLGEVRLAARDVKWDQHRFDRAAAVLRNVHFRPGAPPLVVAAPAELSATLPTAFFDDVLRQAAPQLCGEMRADGTARLHWARRPGWGGLEVDVEAVGATLRLRPRALVTRRRRWSLPAWVPTYPLPLPGLPRGLLLTGVSLGSDSLQVSALLPEWRTELALKHLEDVISHLSRRAGAGALTFVWPRSSD
jgi:hypothetical protein